MSNFANQVEINGIHQNIFNNIVESRKLLVEPTPTDQAATEFVEQTLVKSGWNQPGANRDKLIKNLAKTMIAELDYLLYGDGFRQVRLPRETQKIIADLIQKIINNIIKNPVARGGKRKSRKSRRSRRSRMSRKSRK
jgi:hypothetical protein